MTNFLTLWLLAAGWSAPFEIQVVDDVTRRGVPLVELETTAGVVYVTDSAGIVAFDEPGLMDTEVWFSVKSHGYAYRPDGFGFRGAKLKTTPGERAELEITRLNIAERVCRLSGSDIYRDSVLTGHLPPEEGLLLRAKITGYDSVQAAVYRNEIYWFWGDTNRISYPLGHFHMTGATTPLPNRQNSDPFALPLQKESTFTRYGLDYDYLTDEDGFARGVCQMIGQGPTWIDGVSVVKDGQRDSLMLAAYAKIRPPLEIYRRGICVWNGAKGSFEHATTIPLTSPAFPYGHAQRLTLNGGEEFIVFGDPFPNLRVKATLKDFLDLKEYEAFTPLKPGTTLKDHQLERDAVGTIVYDWKRNTPALNGVEEAEWIKEGHLPVESARWHLKAASNGKTVVAHRGTVRWNPYRDRWVLIATEVGGTSMLGEVWYTEAKDFTGPFGPAVKIITHDKYSFYNPRHHYEFDVDRGRVIYIEGTYTHTFSGNDHRTPRYDYNQMLYRLELSDERLAPAHVD
ncbi:hypothetical protein GC163_21685 [bacterium]|nr:hypothetical protein [bacterium]